MKAGLGVSGKGGQRRGQSRAWVGVCTSGRKGLPAVEWLSQEVVSLSGTDVQGCPRASLSWAGLDHLANVPSQSEDTHGTVKGGRWCCTGRAEGQTLGEDGIRGPESSGTPKDSLHPLPTAVTLLRKVVKLSLTWDLPGQGLCTSPVSTGLRATSGVRDLTVD